MTPEGNWREWCQHPVHTAQAVRFDLVNDMVIDRMQLCFNLLHKEFIDKIWPDVADTADVLISDRTPTTGGLVDRDSFADALNAVKWTREEKT